MTHSLHSIPRFTLDSCPCKYTEEPTTQSRGFFARETSSALNYFSDAHVPSQKRTNGQACSELFRFSSSSGAGIAQWLECQTRDWKVVGSNPRRSGGRIFFSRVNFLCWLLFRYPFHPRVTAVTRKRSRSFCQKCRWQVTAKHIYTLRMWLCMMWHGAWLYGVHRTCADTAAVSCGTSPASAVSIPLRWILKIRAIKS